MLNNKYFGKSIKNLRKTKKCSQLNLSMELNISESYLSKIEIGNKIPTIEMALAMANYFNVGLDELLVQKNDVNVLGHKINHMLDLADKDDYKFLYQSLLNFIEFEKNGGSSYV